MAKLMGGFMGFIFAVIWGFSGVGYTIGN